MFVLSPKDNFKPDCILPNFTKSLASSPKLLAYPILSLGFQLEDIIPPSGRLPILIVDVGFVYTGLVGSILSPLSYDFTLEPLFIVILGDPYNCRTTLGFLACIFTKSSDSPGLGVYCGGTFRVGIEGGIIPCPPKFRLAP